MMSDFDGGMAFPRALEGHLSKKDKGMTKREVFALGALVGAYFSPAGPHDDRTKEYAAVAKRCFELADAMLAESNKAYERGAHE